MRHRQRFHDDADGTTRPGPEPVPAPRWNVDEVFDEGDVVEWPLCRVGKEVLTQDLHAEIGPSVRNHLASQSQQTNVVVTNRFFKN